MRHGGEGARDRGQDARRRTQRLSLIHIFQSTLFQPQGDDEYALYLANVLGTDHTVLTAPTEMVAGLLYDAVLALSLIHIFPERYRGLGLNETDTYFAMARGYQGTCGDVKALAMKKWFNTNYRCV